MSEQNSTTTVGGFSGDLAEAFDPAAGGGCCGSPAANTGTETPTGAAAPCCGTASEAKAEGSCCGSAAKTEAVASGTCGCGA
jgi:hypothetical protein